MTSKRPLAILLLCFLSFHGLHAQIQVPEDDQQVSTPADEVLKGMLAGDSTELDVPNVFTPNDDGINDYFQVTTGGSTVYEFSVFTRTGTRIYYSRSPQISWDGKSIGGKELPEGIYYYVIEAAEGGEVPSENAGAIFLFR